MKKYALTFAAGFATGMISLSGYTKIAKPETNLVPVPAAPVLEKITEEENLLQKCPGFCENRPDRLEAPQFSKSLPSDLKADFSGGVGLRWEPVKGATKYRAIMFDRNGKERAMSLTTKNNRLFFPNLPKPPLGETIQIEIAVAAVDKNEMEGRMSEKRKVSITGTVPLVRAPKVKMIKVED